MKKLTAVFFVLFANIIILAHAVVPHHHLPEQVLIITEHTDDVNGHHHHHQQTKDHHHGQNETNDYDFCLLNQVVTTPVNSLKSDLIPLPLVDFNFANILAVLISDNYFFKPPPIISCRIVTLQNSFNTCSENIVFGFRGPPSA